MDPISDEIKEFASCGQLRSTLIPLITNSYPTDHWPWHAAIYHVDKAQRTYRCGGTLINSKTILTAAHCVLHYNEPLDASKILVYLGKLSLEEIESSGQSFAASFF